MHYFRRENVELIDLLPLKYVFWENEEDIPYVEDAVDEALHVVERDEKEFRNILDSILGGLTRNLKDNDLEKRADSYFEAIKDLDILLERIQNQYPDFDRYEGIKDMVEIIKKRKMDLY